MGSSGISRFSSLEIPLDCSAVVPDDSSRELLAGLDAAGVQTLKYRTGDDADRVEQVNSVQQARFSPGSAQKRTRRTNSDSGVIWAGSDTSQSASLTAAPLRQSDSRSLAGPPIAPLPRNRLAFSAAGGASPFSPSRGAFYFVHPQCLPWRGGAAAGGGEVAFITLFRWWYGAAQNNWLRYP